MLIACGGQSRSVRARRFRQRVLIVAMPDGNRACAPQSVGGCRLAGSEPADLPSFGRRSLKSQRGQGRDTLLTPVAAALLAAAPACGHQSTPVQSPAEVTGSSSSATQELDPPPVSRLDAVIDDAMRSASIPGAIVGVWGPQGRYVRPSGGDRITLRQLARMQSGALQLLR